MNLHSNCGLVKCNTDKSCVETAIDHQTLDQKIQEIRLFEHQPLDVIYMGYLNKENHTGDSSINNYC